MIWELPARYDMSSYQYTIELSNEIFLLKFYFNRRDNRWYMSIYDETENPIILGIPIIINWGLIDRFKMLERPLGSIFAINFSQEEKNPVRKDLGTNVLLFYNDGTV